MGFFGSAVVYPRHASTGLRITAAVTPRAFALLRGRGSDCDQSAVGLLRRWRKRRRTWSHTAHLYGDGWRHFGDGPKNSQHNADCPLDHAALRFERIFSWPVLSG